MLESSSQKKCKKLKIKHNIKTKKGAKVASELLKLIQVTSRTTLVYF